MKRNPDRLIRNFLGISGHDSAQEPTYMGFAMKFDFDNYINKGDINLIIPGLLLPESDLDSSINYLRRIGYEQRANYLRKFREALIDIEENKPWYFQEISGLEEVWKRPDGPENTLAMHDIRLTIDCLESLDLQMTFLASLYRDGSRDRAWLRELLPEDKRRFNFRVIACEIRNLNTVQRIVNSMDQLVNKIANDNNTNNILGDLTLGTGTALNKATAGVLGNLDSAQAYADNKANDLVNKGVPGASGLSSQQAMGTDFQYVEDAYGEGKKIMNNPGQAYKNLSGQFTDLVFEDKGTLPKKPNAYAGGQQLDASLVKDFNRLRDLLVSLEDKISIIHFDFFDCEFIFNSLPWAETLSAARYPEPAKQRFEIKVGDAFISAKFGFFQWITNPDTKKAANPKSWTTPDAFGNGNSYTNLKNSYVRDGFFMIDDRHIMNSDPKPSTDTAVDDSFLAKAERWAGRAAKRTIDGLRNRVGDEVSRTSKEITNELSKLEKKYNSAKMGLDKAGRDLFNVDLKNPESILDAYKKAKDDLFGATAGKTGKSDIDVIKRALEKASIGGNIFDLTMQTSLITKQIADTNLNYRILREYKDKLTGENKFVKNIGDEEPPHDHAPGGLISGSLRKGINGESIPNVGLKDAGHLDKLNPITLEGAGHLEKPTDITLEGAGHLDKLNPITLEGAGHLDKPTGITLEGAGHLDKPTDITLEGAGHLEKPTGITLEGAGHLEKPTGITLEGAGHLEKPTGITLEGAGHLEKPTGITLEGAGHLEKPTGITLEGAGHLEKPTDITLEGAGHLEKPTGITLEGTKPLDKPNSTSVTLEGAKSTSTITKIELTGNKSNNTISEFKLDGAKANTGDDISKITLDGAKANTGRDISKVDKPKPTTPPIITPIKLEGVSTKKVKLNNVGLKEPKTLNKISKIELIGSKLTTNISKNTLTGAKPQTKLTPISLTSAKVLSGKDITKVLRIVPPVNTKITKIKQDSAGKKGKRNITSHKFDKTTVMTKPNPIKFESAGSKKEITLSKLEGAKTISTITKIERKGTKPKTDITKSFITKSILSNKRITKTERTGAMPQEKITAIKLTGASPQKEFSSIKLVGGNKKTSKDIATIKLEGIAEQKIIIPIKFTEIKPLNKKMDNVKLEGTKPRTIINKKEVSKVNISKKLTPIKFESVQPRDKIQPIKFNETPHLTKIGIKNIYKEGITKKELNKISQSPLTGAKPATNISQSPLTGTKPQTIINQTPLEGASHLDNISQNPLEGASKLTSDNITQYKPYGDK